VLVRIRVAIDRFPALTKLGQKRPQNIGGCDDYSAGWDLDTPGGISNNSKRTLLHKSGKNVPLFSKVKTFYACKQ